MKLDFIIHPAQNWTPIGQELNLRTDTLKLLEEKAGSAHHLTDTGRDAMNEIPIAQEIRPTINKRKLLKLKSFCVAKRSVKWVARQAAVGGSNLCQHLVSHDSV